MIKKEKAMELLKDGAFIEFTILGSHYPIYIKHNEKKIYDRIYKKLYHKLQSEKKLELVKKENMSYIYKLK